jgi:hypothetical protein
MDQELFFKIHASYINAESHVVKGLHMFLSRGSLRSYIVLGQVDSIIIFIVLVFHTLPSLNYLPPLPFCLYPRASSGFRSSSISRLCPLSNSTPKSNFSFQVLMQFLM